MASQPDGDLVQHISVLAGVEFDFDMPDEEPCFICGALVDLTRLVPFSFVDAINDDHMKMRMIPEKDARQIIGAVTSDGPGPIICTVCGEKYGDD